VLPCSTVELCSTAVLLRSCITLQVRIQVIPWMIANQQYLTCEKELRETELKYTVFVGNLHGTTTARTLYQAMASAFGGGVVYSAINVDYSKYPIGEVLQLHFTCTSWYCWLLVLVVIVC